MTESSNDSQFQQNSSKNEISRGLPPGFSKTEAEQKNARGTGEDPITKAMVNNLMGNVSNKKTRVTLHCDLCKLEFSSQIPLDMHLKGAKHAKKLRSLEILDNLKQDGQVIQPQGVSNSLRCEICDVIGNSTQQLQMHLTGSKHKSKCRSLGIDPSCIQKPSTSNVNVNVNVNVEEEKSLKRPFGEVEAEVETEHNKVAESSQVQTSKPPQASKMGRFCCQTCEVTLNSEVQLQQHMDSKKHRDRLEGKKTTNKKFWWKKKKNPKNAAAGSGPSMNMSSDMPINQTFVKGETMQ